MGMFFGEIADAFFHLMMKLMVKALTGGAKLAYLAIMKDVNKNDGTTKSDWEEKAKNGNAEAQCRLGGYYYDKQDYKKAQYWWEKSANQGYKQAKEILDLFQKN